MIYCTVRVPHTTVHGYKVRTQYAEDNILYVYMYHEVVCVLETVRILRGSYSMTANRFFTFVILQAGRIYNLHAVRDLRVKILFCFTVAF